MARVLLCFFMVLSCMACRKDSVLTKSDTCSAFVSQEAENYFRSSAQDFAYLEISNNPDHFGYNLFKIEEHTINYFLGKLSAIYQKAIDSTDVLHDMIFKYAVQNTNQRLSLKSIIVMFNSNSTVLAEIHSNEATYSEPFLNKMKNEYWLYPKTYNSMYTKVNFISEVPFNVGYIESNVKELDEVNAVYLDSYGGNAHTIVHSKDGIDDIFIFKHGWGDCMAGCFYHHYWKIKVSENCSVELLEEYGDELPE